MKIYHLDMKMPMYRMEYLKSWFNRLHASGYGGVCVEIDNKLRFPSHPEFAAEDAWDAGDWNVLAKYARDIGLTIYPLVQTLGHMQHVLVPDTDLMRLAEMPGDRYLMCPSRPETLEFIKDLIRDADEVFDHPGITHLGGDEYRGLGACPRCHGCSESEMLTDYMRSLIDYALQLNARPEFWADMVLAHPECLDRLPKETRFVDWLYTRAQRYQGDVGISWGCHELCGKSLAELKSRIPEHLRVLLPYMIADDDKFDNYYGAVFLRDKGFDVKLASGVRSAGDGYCLPRPHLGIANVATTETVARELYCDHMVTSWAVRLSHPETTWPGLLARDAGDIESPERVTESMGGIDSDAMKDMTAAVAGIDYIDRLPEATMRFERPYYGGYVQAILDMVNEEKYEDQAARIQNRLDAARRLLPTIEANLSVGKGDDLALRHWLLGMRMCALKSEEALAVMNQYVKGFDRNTLRGLIEKNELLMEEFGDLWRESVTDISLEQEVEIKFRRNIRVLGEIMG